MKPQPLGIVGCSVSTELELAASSREAGSSWPGDRDTDDTSSTAVTAVVKSAGEARPPGIAKHSAAIESELSVSPAEAGPFRPRADGTTSADESVVAKPIDEARPLEITMYTVAKYVADGEPRPPGECDDEVQTRRVGLSSPHAIMRMSSGSTRRLHRSWKVQVLCFCARPMSQASKIEKLSSAFEAQSATTTLPPSVVNTE